MWNLLAKRVFKRPTGEISLSLPFSLLNRPLKCALFSRVLKLICSLVDSVILTFKQFKSWHLFLILAGFPSYQFGTKGGGGGEAPP